MRRTLRPPLQHPWLLLVEAPPHQASEGRRPTGDSLSVMTVLTVMLMVKVVLVILNPIDMILMHGANDDANDVDQVGAGPLGIRA